jgi:malonyl-CoA/methylmalonyl-CoA synthetase
MSNVYAAMRQSFPPELDRIAIETDDGQCHSWRELEQRSAQFANLFTALGLTPGERVAVQVEKSVAAMCIYLATLRAGLVLVPLNTAYEHEELSYFLKDATPSLFIGTRARTQQWGHVPIKHMLTLDEGDAALAAQSAPDMTCPALLTAAQACSDSHLVVKSAASDLALLLYTSGTTGRSKGAMLTHGNILSNALTLKEVWGWQTQRDVLIHALPIFHVHGLLVALGGALLAGCRQLWMSKFDARRSIAWFSEATVFMGVPTLYTRMLQEASLTLESCKNMRLFLAGSAPLQIETYAAWQARTGHTIVERYGMSETIMLCSNSYSAPELRQAGCVGTPLPGVNLRIASLEDPSAGECPVEVVGEIQVQGESVFSGYWQMPDKTAEAFTADHFFKTGDLGVKDTKGRVRIVGRNKDLIISGGYNVYPAEVEAVLQSCAGVAEAALVAAPHPDFGEVGVAYVVPQAGAVLAGETLLSSLKGRIANFKIPKKCIPIDALPRNSMGKVQKQLLRAQCQHFFTPSSQEPT